MLKTVEEWREVLCCPVCLIGLEIDGSGDGFLCGCCKQTFSYKGNIPAMVPEKYRSAGVKESTELAAQMKEHANKYIEQGTNERVLRRIADLLAKHGIETDLQTRILEIESGPFESLHDAVGGVKIGVDPLASSYWNNLPFVRSNSNITEAQAEVLPFRDEFFDVLASRNSFDHLNDPELALLEFHRVLKKSGTCVIECYVDSDAFMTHEPFVLTERFVDRYISAYFHIVHRKRLQKPANFSYDWIELVLRPKDVTLSHRPYTPAIYGNVAESYLEMFSKGCAMIQVEDYEKAIEYLKHSVEKNKSHFWNSVYLIYACLKAKKDVEARLLIDKVESNILKDAYPYVDDPSKLLNNVINF